MGFYYGWVIVGLSMVSLAFWFGLRTTFSVFFVALTDDFKWNRADAAAAQSIALMVYAIISPILGSFIDRVGPRKIIVPGIILTGLGLLLCTQIETLGQFYLFFGVIVGTGVTCLSLCPITIVLTHWFERNRGTASGLATVGIGFSSFFFVPFFQFLINIQNWRFAYLIFSLMIFLIPLPLIAIFMRHRPQDMGMLPDGDPFEPNQGAPFQKDNSHGDSQSSLSNHEWTVRDLMKTARFWYFILFPSLSVSSLYIIVVHHVRYLVDLGVDKMWAASLFAVAGALSSGFRFFWGWLSDRVGREIIFTVGEICFALGVLFLLLFQYSPSVVAFLYLFAFFFSAGWGVTSPIFMSISGDLYKGRNFGLIYGMVEGGIGMGGALGAWVAGYIFDQYHNYFWAFILAILFNIVSIFLVWIVAPRKVYQIKTAS